MSAHINHTVTIVIHKGMSVVCALFDDLSDFRGFKLTTIGLYVIGLPDSDMLSLMMQLVKHDKVIVCSRHQKDILIELSILMMLWLFSYLQLC